MFRNILTISAIALLALVGCGSPDPQFREYSTFLRLAEKKASTNEKEFTIDSARRQEINNVVEALFGTPESPLIPNVGGFKGDIDSVFQIEKLKLSAGRVRSDDAGIQYGLYREHCAHCHGITGDGNGPTAAFLNPYPRDYRPAIYKFKSTGEGKRPTHDDLVRVLKQGIPGTAMPSFALLPEQEIESLVQYVKYLTIRGETERKLIQLAADKPTASLADSQDAIKKVVQGTVQKWIDDNAKGGTVMTARPPMDDAELAASVARGKDLFYGKVAICTQCHGQSALGDGQLTGIDSWTEEFSAKKEDWPEFVALGMPEPRYVKPRNLRQGVFRGGRRPVDVFWRIRNGIAGTKMPGNNVLTDEQVWDLVNYVQSLPYEGINDPRKAEEHATDLRDRM